MNLISLWTTQFFNKENIKFHFEKSTSSVNDLAKAQAFKTKSNPFLFVTDHQTKGRGSNSHRWEDSDLMLSYLWHKGHKDELDFKNQAGGFEPQVCEDFSKDAQKALQKTWPCLELSFKAPNDLYLKDKKLAGLLMELLSQGSKRAFILGLGLNVFSAPANVEAAYLKEQTENLSVATWWLFLSRLFANWSKRLSSL